MLYHLGDALGSVRQLLDAGGEVKLARSYEPYGSVLSSSGNGGSAYAFTGEAQDMATGLVFLRARYLSVGQGRFLNADPSQQEENLFVYAQGNPVNRIDPTGLFSKQLIANSLGDSSANFEQVIVQMYQDEIRVTSVNYSYYPPWGLIAALLDAEDGDQLNVALFTGSRGSNGLSVVFHGRLTSDCDRILIDGKPILQDLAFEVSHSHSVNGSPDSYSGRNKRTYLSGYLTDVPTHYILVKDHAPGMSEYVTGTDDGLTGQPDFVILDASLSPGVVVGAAGSLLVDRFGNIYGGFTLTAGVQARIPASLGGGIGVINPTFPPSTRRIPATRQEVEQTLGHSLVCVGDAVYVGMGGSLYACAPNGNTIMILGVELGQYGINIGANLGGANRLQSFLELGCTSTG